MMPIKTTEDLPTPALVVWHERLKFCGCGCPELVLRHIRDAMRAMKNWSDYNRKKPLSSFAFGGEKDPQWEAICEAKRKALGGGEGDDRYGAFFYLTAYVLTAADLEEHGGSAPGWLTEDGEQLLAFLESTPEDQWMRDPLMQ